MLILNILIFIGTFFLMEFTAWFAHKHLMHGALWFLHKDHHQTEPGFFEKNDLFFLIFAVPSWLSIMFGTIYGWNPLIFFGSGIAFYGFCYFLIHDVLIHRRFAFLQKTNSAYFRAIRKAHKIHHKHLGKEEGECFGMLIVPMKYLNEAKNALNK